MLHVRECQGKNTSLQKNGQSIYSGVKGGPKCEFNVNLPAYWAAKKQMLMYISEAWPAAAGIAISAAQPI